MDIRGSDILGYVNKAKTVLDDKVVIPASYSLVWSGQYEYMERAKERLKLVVPLTLAIIFLLLFLNFRSVTESLIVMLSIPFSLAGGIWLMYLLGYNMSVAVWVGFIALAGLAAEIGVIMLVYLDMAYARCVNEEGSSLNAAVIEGASLRIRPVMMTVCAVIGGLLPIMWGSGTGSEVMRRIAAPMVGGMVSATVITLIVLPVIYAIWKGRSLEGSASRGAEKKD